MLQWGRSVSAAETEGARLGHLRHRLLQWGRSVSAAETLDAALPWWRELDASMGPQRFSCGNAEREKEGGEQRESFNGAAAFQLRKPI